MAKSNRDRVSDVMYAVKDGLGPFVLREYKMVYKTAGFLQALEDVLRGNNSYHERDRITDVNDALANIDAPGWLKAMMFNWNEVFRNKLGHTERSYVSELLSARND